MTRHEKIAALLREARDERKKIMMRCIRRMRRANGQQ